MPRRWLGKLVDTRILVPSRSSRESFPRQWRANMLHLGLACTARSRISYCIAAPDNIQSAFLISIQAPSVECSYCALGHSLRLVGKNYESSDLLAGCTSIVIASELGSRACQSPMTDRRSSAMREFGTARTRLAQSGPAERKPAYMPMNAKKPKDP
jgi:hypothetical protein